LSGLIDSVVFPLRGSATVSLTTLLPQPEAAKPRKRISRHDRDLKGVGKEERMGEREAPYFFTSCSENSKRIVVIKASGVFGSVIF
jgi:hypothetical protein